MSNLVKMAGIAAVLCATASCSWLGLNKSPAPGKEANSLVVPPIYDVRPDADAAVSPEIEQSAADSAAQINELNEEIDLEIQKLNNAEALN